MKRIFTVIILLLIAGSTFADSGALSGVSQFAANLSPPSTDYSVAYLSQIFGTVGTVLQSSSGQMLGQMFDIFNKGILVAAALYLGVVTVQTTLRAAHEGSAMGQNKNVPLLLLRIAFGFALLIPSSATGYSLLQDGYMKIVVEGAGLADQVWDAALKYIEYGGELYIPPRNMQTDNQMILNQLGTSAADDGTGPTTVGPVSQIFQDEVCMLSSKQWQETQNKDSGVKNTYVQSYHVVYSNSTNGYIYFPGLLNNPSAGADAYAPSPASGSAQVKPSCGYVKDYYLSQNPSPGTLPEAKAQMQMYSYGALKQLVESLLPAAKNFVNNNAGTDTVPQADNEKIVLAALIAYNNLMIPYQRMLNSSEAIPTNREGFIPKAKKQGWIMAGAFFWNLERSNINAAALNASNLVPTAPTLNSMGGEPGRIWDKYNGLIGWDKGAAGAYIQSATFINDVGQKWADFVGVQQNGNSTDQSNLLDNKHINPIVALMAEGLKLLNWVIVMWTLGAALSIGVAAGLGWCAAESPGSAIARATTSWVKTITMTISTALFIPGAILSYYVPFYPFAVFTFAAIGWFLLVIEGMAAAPLVCLGMTHPEGHDFLGKAEQALMLVLSIFVRPALLVLGFVAAMLISFVAFKMMNVGFSQVYLAMEDSSQGAIGAGLFLSLLVVVYAFIVMELIEQCYKLTFQLPNNIMSWIGGPQTGQDVGQMVSAIKGGVSSGASSLGQGVDSGSKTEDIGKGRAEDKKNKDDAAINTN